MDKTININLGGTLFQIDEEAFKILRDYLQEINNRFRNVQGGLETIEDIESRIAEIFQSQKGLAGVITMQNVDAMISIIGKPEDFDQNNVEDEPPSHTSYKRRLYRNPDDSIVSGVCGGIGAYLNTDPVLFRILFVISVLFFGVGFFIYIALWIALTQAYSDIQKRELFGGSYQSSGFHNKQSAGIYSTTVPKNTGYNTNSPIGNALNEVFRAIGKVLYIAIRILLIFIGAILILTGFLTILSLIMIFVFKFPGFSTDGFDINLIYFPDFLNYIVSPTLAPWIIILTIIAIALPMLALIYWGVKMIFWFNAKDGVLSLVALILWVMSFAALSMILFNEGISFAETAKSSSQEILTETPETLYIMTDNKVSDLRFDKELSIKEKGGRIFINEEKKELYISPDLYIRSSDGDIARIEVKKRSSGRSKRDAMRKTDDLLYNYTLNGDTLFLDEYFTIPSGRKWSADYITISLYIPEGTILKFDKDSENLFHSYTNYKYKGDFIRSNGVSDTSTWILTDKGLQDVNKNSSKQK